MQEIVNEVNCCVQQFRNFQGNIFSKPCLWVPVTTAWRLQVADGGTAFDMEGSCE